MNLAVDLLIILAVWRWADWRNWRKYHASMLFAKMMCLLYNVMALTDDYFLWKMVPSYFSYTVEEIIHCFILLPGTALLFLSTWPQGWRRQIKHLLKWIIIYIIGEIILSYFEGIQYFNGWRLGYSFLFNCVMFPGILLHYKKPHLAYPLFFLVTLWGVWYFKIPLGS